MRYLERKEFLYEPEIFKRSDTITALRIHAEYVLKHSARPRPHFFEVNRADQQFDPLWHMPVTERFTFTRVIEVPAIITFDKPSWTIRKQGQIPKQRFSFWLANLHLMPQGANPIAVPWGAHPEKQDGPNPYDPKMASEAVRVDYFPQRGDYIFHAGYRLMIQNCVPDPTAYWQQTNVWLGIIAEAIIVPE